MAFRVDLLTLFPEIFEGFLSESLLKRAQAAGLVSIYRHNIRDWTADQKHHKVDDRPYGGGPGMVIAPQPVFDCVEAVRRLGNPVSAAGDVDPGLLIMLTPQGEPFTQAVAAQLVCQRRLLLLCGRYEGFDERVRLGLQPRELSIGEYVCNGGEVPAMVVLEATLRLLPGFLGDENSAAEESFSQPDWVEYPQYTRPPDFRGMTVPDVLLSGHHQQIADWRAQQARLRSEHRLRLAKG